MTRHPDWKPRLTRYITAAWARPFAFGTHDCALFAAGAVEAMTGTDPAAPWRGRYTTPLGAVRVLRKSGHADHIAATAAQFRPRGDVARARPGDLAVIPTDDGPALGVVQGEGVYALSPVGVFVLPLADAVTVFEVP